MRISAQTDPITLTRRYVVEVTDGDIMDAGPFIGVDADIVRECSDSDSVADKLLGLEFIARRVEQRRVPRNA